MPIVETLPARTYSDRLLKFGQNDNISLGETEDVIKAGGDQYWPASAVAAGSINIVSSSAADAAAGTGARTIEIQGLDANYLLQSETVALNGTTNVNPTKAYLRIFRAKVLTAGSGGVNAGNITIADGSGTLAYIGANEGQTLQAAYTVPANYSHLWVNSWKVSVSGSSVGNIDAFLQIRAVGMAWNTKYTIDLSEGTTIYIPLADDGYITVPAKTDIRVRATSTANNMKVSSAFAGLLI